MNRQKTAIMVDSGCDLPRRFVQKHDIRVVPLRVIYPEKDYEDGIDIDPEMVYERFPEEFPSTSMPSLAEITDMMRRLKDEGYEKAIAMTISSQLSGTYNAFRLAAEQMRGELDIFVFDTKNISVAAGFFAIWATWMLEHGEPFDEIVMGLKDKIGDCKVFFYMDSLEYLKKGGRIGHVTSLVGKALRLRPIISCNEEGVYYTVSLIRGSKHAKLRLFEEAVKFGFSHRCWAIVGHGDAPAEAEEFRSMLTAHARNDNVLFVKQITATMAINTGPGLLGVAVFKEPFSM